MKQRIHQCYLRFENVVIAQFEKGFILFHSCVFATRQDETGN